MESLSVKSPVGWRMLVMLHILLGTGAVFGGIALVIDPSGTSVNLPVAILDASPFRDFLIPGLLLFFVLGVLPLMTAYGLFTVRPWELASKVNVYKKMHWAWNWSLYTAFAVIAWNAVLMVMIREVSVLHVVFAGVGLVMLAVTLLPSVRDIFRLEEKTEMTVPTHPQPS